MFEIMLLTSAILCVIVAILIYCSLAPNIIKFIALPFTMIFCAGTLWMFVSLSGAPIEAQPSGKWHYAAHVIENSGETIVLWAWIEDLKDYRLYRFPYDREIAKKLNQIKEESNQQTTHTGEIKKGKRGEPDFLYIEKHRRASENPPPKE